MKNQIRTIDLIKYFQTRADKFIAIRNDLQIRFDNAEAEFNKTIWHRWFKETYRDCMRWDDSIWELDRNIRLVEQIHGILNQLEYRTKCGYETTFWDWKDWDKASFYNWCADNNIPY